LAVEVSAHLTRLHVLQLLALVRLSHAVGQTLHQPTVEVLADSDLVLQAELVELPPQVLLEVPVVSVRPVSVQAVQAKLAHQTSSSEVKRNTAAVVAAVLSTTEPTPMPFLRVQAVAETVVDHQLHPPTPLQLPVFAVVAVVQDVPETLDVQMVQTVDLELS